MLLRYLYLLKKKQYYFFLKPSKIYHLNKKIRINSSAFFFKFDITNIVYINNVDIQLLPNIECSVHLNQVLFNETNQIYTL